MTGERRRKLVKRHTPWEFEAALKQHEEQGWKPVGKHRIEHTRYGPLFQVLMEREF